jgi:uncharacterized protein YuzE
MKKNDFSFRVSIEIENDTGRVLAVYLQVREGRSATVKEYADGKVLADYDRHGTLLGIEILSPCDARVLDKIAVQAQVKRFVRNNVPRDMLVAA